MEPQHGNADEVRAAFDRIYADQIPNLHSDEFNAEYARWLHTPVRVRGAIGALISTCGSEIHVGVDPDLREHWFPFKAFRERMNALIGLHGRVTTVDLMAGRSHAFIMRLGFSLDRVDPPRIRYVRSRPYHRIDGPRRPSTGRA